MLRYCTLTHKNTKHLSRVYKSLDNKYVHNLKYKPTTVSKTSYLIIIKVPGIIGRKYSFPSFYSHRSDYFDNVGFSK